MITINKKIVLSGLVAVVTLTGVSLFATNYASAQSADGPYTSLVQKIADKFGLNKDEVQAVFEDERSERHSQMQAKFEEKLTQAVKDGKLTEAQKQLILDKHKELQEKRQSESENLKEKTPEERKAAMQEEREALEEWAEQNDIDLEYLHGGLGNKVHMHWHVK